jgi:hypothetical protein
MADRKIEVCALGGAAVSRPKISGTATMYWMQ